MSCVYAYRPPTAAIVVDARNGNIVYGENIDAPRHPASLVKKMTLYLIFDALKKGKIKLSTRYSVSRHANRQIPCKLGVPIGKSVTVDVIIRALVTKSANDMAVVAAEGIYGSLDECVRVMNVRAKELGMNRTTFTNASGVPDRRQITTARDMVILAQSLYNHFPEYWKYFQIRSFTHSGQTHHNHNHLMKQFPAMDGLKTGFTNASGFNLSTSAVRYTPKGEAVRLFAVVIGGTTRHTRDRRMKDLLETHFRKLNAPHVREIAREADESVVADSTSQLSEEASLSDTLFTEIDDEEMAYNGDEQMVADKASTTDKNVVAVSLPSTADAGLSQYIEASFDQNKEKESVDVLTEKSADTLSEMLEKTVDDTSIPKTTLKKAKSSKKMCVKKSKKSRKRISRKSKRSSGVQESA